MAFTNSQTLLKQPSSFIVFNMMQDTDPSNALMYEVGYEMSLDDTSDTTHGLVNVPRKGEFPPGLAYCYPRCCLDQEAQYWRHSERCSTFMFRTREQNVWRQKRKKRLFTTAGE
jgi:hypothetical protein